MKACECGCGQMVRRRFARGHNQRVAGTGRARYLARSILDRAGRKRLVRVHVLVASEALGKPLPPGAQVHHVNGDKKDNRPQNLVICEDAAYHVLIEQRTRALEACGNANWVRCCRCGEYDDPDDPDIYIGPESSKGRVVHHRSCVNRYQRERRRAA